MSDQQIIDLGNQINAYGVQHTDKMAALEAARLAAQSVADNIFAPQNTVLNVGPNGDFADIITAWYSLRGKLLGGLVTIKVENGIHLVPESLYFHHHDAPNAGKVQIIGNLADPAQCVLKLVPQNDGHSEGVIFRGVKGLTFGGFKIVGNAADFAELHRGIYLDHAEVFVPDNSLIIEHTYMGIEAYTNSVMIAPRLQILNSTRGIRADASFLNLHALKCINDVPNNNGVAIQPYVGGQVFAYAAVLDGFNHGVQAIYSAQFVGSGVTVKNAAVGFESSNGSEVYAVGASFENVASQYSPATNQVLGNANAFVTH